MLDFKDILQSIQSASIGAVEGSKPVTIAFGKVESPKPISVKVENKMSLEKEQLIVPACFQKFEVPCEIDGKKGKAKFDNTLKAGEEVILLRLQGGQQYLILDRLIK